MLPVTLEQIHTIDHQTRERMSPKCSIDEYDALHTDVLMPTSIKVDVESFRDTMRKYNSFFKSWSKNRPEMWEIRKGLPLVNLTGRFDDEDDVTIGPLDYYNKLHPDKKLLECDITIPTPVLHEQCFSPMDILKPYLLRTSILKWDNGANFVPHIDMIAPTTHLRLWGTDNPDSIKLRFESDNAEFVEIENVEPGRLYIINTAIMHDALCTGTTGYQFFISVRATAYDLLKHIKI
jgi:hypothetical protein